METASDKEQEANGDVEMPLESGSVIVDVEIQLPCEAVAPSAS